MIAPLLLAAGPAAGRMLLVGPGQPLHTPSAAAATAQDGDTVLIEPGEYYDCALWTRDRLIIAGAAPGVVITDTTCQGKALFIVAARDTTIRDLTLARSRVPDGNGAGIRLEGPGLTLQRVHFVNNQVGLLSGAVDGGSILVADCRFEGGGSGGDHPTFAVLVGAASLLRIEGSSFKDVRGGQISTSAARTELEGNQIDSGEAPAISVASDGGHLVMRDNQLSIESAAPRLGAAVLVTGSDVPELRRNRLSNMTGQPMALLLDWSGMDPLLEGNQIQPGDIVLSTRGIWRHRAAGLYHEAKDHARALARRALDLAGR